jgi:hypothetical protein
MGLEYGKAARKSIVPFERCVLILLRAIVPHAIDADKPVTDCSAGKFFSLSRFKALALTPNTS